MSAPRYSLNYFESGNVSAAAGKIAFTIARAGRIVECRATVGTAPASQALLVNVKKNGTTIFTNQANRVTIAASATSGTGTPEVQEVSAGDRITVDVDQVGTGTVGAGLALCIQIEEAR